MSKTTTITANVPAIENPIVDFLSGHDLDNNYNNGLGKDAVINATAEAVMNVLVSFSELNTNSSKLHAKESFGPRVRRFVAANRQIHMVLPAFPGKSRNTTAKVLGHLPDLGEELSLARLDDLCSQIKQLYCPGAKVVIAMDGACYHDILGYTADDIWQYDLTLRQMVAKTSYDCFEFVHLMNLVGMCTKPTITKQEFLDLLEPAKDGMMAKYLPRNFDVENAINSDSDMKSTYLAYCKFLTKDLTQLLKASGYSCKGVKRKVHTTAKTMITRGAAFAEIIQQRYPDCVRLSIHPSNGTAKIPIALIPSPGSVSMTPWHCAVAVDIYGNFRTGHVIVWRETHDLICKDGRPYYFRERSPLYNWDAQVEFEHLYKGGLVVHNVGGADQTQKSLSAADKEKAVTLAFLQGKLVLQGF
ncbi:pyoverdine/dityrosine biosynthesis protein [Colletotrichum zoysiae]|uniref:Pyoverdine/dityrosine biosynthesis protein n=1 Tax=Colletotrichum zoysiae TaxID=1216348 RepID=A0AAD9HJN9_9PEZI|nr:pyoverdine/dityrosine biosynthesis protein [Colletotrichum zoysiae]